MQQLAQNSLQTGSMTGTRLKVLAMVLMVLDHIGAVLLMPYVAAGGGGPWGALLYLALRTVGRLAFPIFCFLLVEGFFYTHDRKKYLLRLAAFALLSEPAFDIAVQQRWFDPTSQNVFFTLALGLVAIGSIDGGRTAHRSALGWCGALLCMVVAWLLRSDYEMLGVLIILVFYLFRGRRGLYVALPVALFFGDIATMAIWSARDGLALPGGTNLVAYALQETCGALSLLPIGCYHGRRGAGLPKYFFYLFYPAHLLLLAGLRFILMGL